MVSSPCRRPQIPFVESYGRRHDEGLFSWRSLYWFQAKCFAHDSIFFSVEFQQDEVLIIHTSVLVHDWKLNWPERWKNRTPVNGAACCFGRDAVAPCLRSPPLSSLRSSSGRMIFGEFQNAFAGALRGHIQGSTGALNVKQARRYPIVLTSNIYFSYECFKKATLRFFYRLPRFGVNANLVVYY
jgi:hypothetical protein